MASTQIKLTKMQKLLDNRSRKETKDIPKPINTATEDYIKIKLAETDKKEKSRSKRSDSR
jgi:hypothetical protein